MLSNLSIRQKMLLLILGLTIITYLITFAYIILSVRSRALNEGKKTAQLVAQKKANEVKAVIDEDLAVARVMAEAVEDMTYLPEEERNRRRKEFLDRILIQYPKYDATWMSWQYEFLDDTWDKTYGRERFNSYLENGEVKSSVELAEMDGSKASSIYENVKADPNLDELLSDPYWFMDYDYTDNTNDSLLAISTVVRLEVDGRFAGVVGADMSVSAFEEISNVDYYENAYAVLLSSSGVITSYKDPKYFNSPMDSLSIFRNGSVNVREKVIKGEAIDYTIMDESLGEKVYVSFAPIPIGRTSSYWTVCTIVPIEEIMAPYTQTFSTSIIVVIISVLILTVSILYISYSITNPLSRSTRLLEDLSEGKLDAAKKLKVRGRDEISKISGSLNRLIDSLNLKAEFAQKIGQGNLDTKIIVDKNDVLGMALVDMQNSLKTAIGDIKSLVKASESISDNVVSQAENINRTANTGYITSNNGLKLVEDMTDSMRTITSIASETNSSFQVLEQRSKDISKVVKVITDLSKKTNLLAINAAIQASQAGEAGKGFAVVANEIRKLAESSEKSAKEINQLVVRIQEDTLKASEMINQMNESIQKGESVTGDTSAAFKNISNSITETVGLSESILRVAHQQINKIKEVSRNTENIVVES